MAGLSTNEIRATFLRFFQAHAHVIVPSTSLIAPKGSVLLFTTAGVDQFLPFMLGHAQPPHRRLASVQKVFRTTDLDEVGDTYHHTFFEMLGNWSIGDYFKQEAIAYAWELSTGPFGIDPKRVSVTVHPDDDVSPDAWRRVGVPPERIVPLAENWWPEADAIGPCGPDTEMFYDLGADLGCGKPDCGPACDCGRFVEFWNLVFMQFDRDAQRQLSLLPTANVDTGMGVDRMACIQQGVRTTYETDALLPILTRVAGIAQVAYGAAPASDRSLRIITDHARSATFLLADGVRPENEGRGYVLRRIIRRAVRQGVLLGIKEPFLVDLASVVITQYGEAYPELGQRTERIHQWLADEERRFTATLEAGMAAFERVVQAAEQRGGQVIPGDQAFRLYDSQGLPLEVVQELAAERGMTVDVAGFEAEMAKQVAAGKTAHRRQFTGAVGEAASSALATLDATEFTGYMEVESTATVLRLLVGDEAVALAEAGQQVAVILDRTPFYVQSGGQVSDTGTIRAGDAVVTVDSLEKLAGGAIFHRGTLTGGALSAGDRVVAAVDAERRAAIRRNHTATHLLHRALRGQLGEHVEQAGSVVAPQHLTFDFTHGARLDPERIASLEQEINQRIEQDAVVSTAIKPLAEARAEGAMALFGEKYGDEVRVVSIDGYSKELCGGTHVGRTGEIGALFIVAETGIGAGVRRIEAVTGQGAVVYTRGLARLLDEAAQQLKAPVAELPRRLQASQQEAAELRRKLQNAERELLKAQASRLAAEAISGPDYRIVSGQVQVEGTNALRSLADFVLDRVSPAVVLLAAPQDGRAQLLAAVSRDVAGSKQDAAKLVRELARRSGGGGGGGNPQMATGSTPNQQNVGAALASLRDELAQGPGQVTGDE